MNPYEERQTERDTMVQDQIAGRGVRDTHVLAAMRRIPRHAFIPPHTDAASRAYADGAQPIGEGQTISQPYIVALMTESLALTGTETVLEIGAGSGYQTALLAALAARVIAIERHAPLAERAGRALGTLGLSANVRLLVGDGSRGWAADAPYDA
ncbi:MAG: protein-L-isoaspartate O-methyltransferase, partial [Cytophagales bacterium]|nr:protein-L-isoaspartate O-methyltransferase [Armatimonadota bacterium]